MKNFKKDIFGYLSDQPIYRYQFENESGYVLSVMTYGATILGYQTPDRQGNFANIILGYEDFESYIGNGPKHGAGIGPVAGRIEKGRFCLNGQDYHLEVNSGPNCNHSGSTGWDSSIFEVEEVSDEGLTLYTERLAETGGFPANLRVFISYLLLEDGTVEISYQVETDQDTLVNPTNHSYFNLTGNPHVSIDQHQLRLEAEGFYPVNEVSIPERNLDCDSDFFKDLQAGVVLGEIFENSHEQLAIVGGGLDHPFKLSHVKREVLDFFEPSTGRYLTASSDRPILVLYSANYPDDKDPSRPLHNGLALEFQAIPNAIHRPEKEQVILRAGQVFTSTSNFRAGVR